MQPQPYVPTDDLTDWREIYEMLCGFCAHQIGCDVVEGMIEMKHGANWPNGGWVHDNGAGVSCLSYSPRSGVRMTRQQLRAIGRKSDSQLPPVCGGCAALKGTEASISRHTREDFRSAVRNKTRFLCHETKKDCGGWCRAITKRPTPTDITSNAAQPLDGEGA